MPGIGKSGKFRSAARRLIFALESSVGRAVGEAERANCPVALSVVEVLSDRAAESVCCVVIVEREKRGRGEVICK